MAVLKKGLELNYRVSSRQIYYLVWVRNAVIDKARYFSDLSVIASAWMVQLYIIITLFAIKAAFNVYVRSYNLQVAKDKLTNQECSQLFEQIH